MLYLLYGICTKRPSLQGQHVAGRIQGEGSFIKNESGGKILAVVYDSGCNRKWW